MTLREFKSWLEHPLYGFAFVILALPIYSAFGAEWFAWTTALGFGIGHEFAQVVFGYPHDETLGRATVDVFHFTLGGLVANGLGLAAITFAGVWS